MADGVFHGVDGGGHERAQAHGHGIVSAAGFGHRFLVDVLAKVNHLVAMALHHNFHDVLADVVDVAFDGGNDHGAFVSGVVAGISGRQDFEGGLGCFGRLDELRQEDRFLFEAFAHFGQGRNQYVADDAFGCCGLQFVLDVSAHGVA